MEPRVVAIVVAREGGEHLARTLRAIAAQTRQPELIILVDNASREELGSQFHTGKASVVRLTHQRAFGEC
jgi:GT2 family glycosyltransferase